MSFSRPIQWYHSHADPIWPDGTFNCLSTQDCPLHAISISHLHVQLNKKSACENACSTNSCKVTKAYFFVIGIQKK